MATTNSWSTGSITKLKTLLERGLSTAEIGKRLGFTKNAVVGKINRLGLNAGKEKQSAAKKPAGKAAVKPAAKPVKKAPLAKPAAQKAPVKKPEVKSAKPTKPAPVPKGKSGESKQNAERIIRHSDALMALRADQCRWPLGDPDADSFRFCGEKCFAGKPYCFEHCKVAYQFSQPTRRR